MPNRDHIFYPSLAVMISLICFAGFSFTYFDPIMKGAYPPSGLALHVHGWSFFLWYILFPTQAILIARGKNKYHRLFGYISIPLAILMTLTGFLVLTVRVEEAMRNGAPEVWLLYGPLILLILVMFDGFYLAAVYMAVKKRLQSHIRLMIVASAIALGAGFFRLILFLSGFHPLSLPIGTLSCGLFIVFGMVYDGVAKGKVHRAYVIGLTILIVVESLLLPQLNGELVAWINEGMAVIGEQMRIFYTPDPTIEF